MNCHEMMQMPELQGVMNLRAGEKGLDNSIRWIYFADCLQCIGDVRRLGAMIGIELVKDTESKEPATELTAKLIENAMQKGLLLESCGTASNTIRFLAPLVMTDEQMARGLEIFEEALREAMDSEGLLKETKTA